MELNKAVSPVIVTDTGMRAWEYVTQRVASATASIPLRGTSARDV